MTARPGERLLLVAPTFHGYHRSIAAGFRQLGLEVVTHCYDDYSALTAKLRNKVLWELPGEFGADRRHARRRWDTARALEALREVRPDRLLVIKGDSLGEDFWAEARRRGIPTMLWLYDDLHRHEHSREFLREVGPVLSYAVSEAARLRADGVDAHHLPNGWDPDLARPAETGAGRSRRGEIVFVGARYPNRESLLRGLHEAGVPVRAYGRQWSRHPIDRLRTWDLRRPPLPAHRDIPLAEAYRVQAAAAGTLNIHGLQAGLSMRTFEVPGMGGVQLIDRADVADHYEPDREVLVFTDEEELTALCRRLIADPRWADDLRAAARRRSLAEHTFAHRAATAWGWWT